MSLAISLVENQLVTKAKYICFEKLPNDTTYKGPHVSKQIVILCFCTFIDDLTFAGSHNFAQLKKARGDEITYTTYSPCRIIRDCFKTPGPFHLGYSIGSFINDSQKEVAPVINDRVYNIFKIYRNTTFHNIKHKERKKNPPISGRIFL